MTALSQPDARRALEDAFDRMMATITQETALLSKNRAVELGDFNHRKRQGLLEISRILRTIAPPDLAQVERSRVDRLVALLEENQKMLAHHLQAVDEISSLIARAMQEAESDGTYGRG